jgi:hypothetical protein
MIVKHGKLTFQDPSQETFDDFENHTRGIISKLMRQMGYDVQGIGEEGQGILSHLYLNKGPSMKA